MWRASNKTFAFLNTRRTVPKAQKSRGKGAKSVQVIPNTFSRTADVPGVVFGQPILSDVRCGFGWSEKSTQPFLISGNGMVDCLRNGQHSPSHGKNEKSGNRFFLRFPLHYLFQSRNISSMAAAMAASRLFSTMEKISFSRTDYFRFFFFRFLPLLVLSILISILPRW